MKKIQTILNAKRCTLYAKRGFSLIEIIVVITIGSLLTFALGELIVRGYRTYAITTEQTTQTALARRAQDNIVRALRAASISDHGDYPIAVAETDRMTFYSDVNGDTSRERIRYWRDGQLFSSATTIASGNPPAYNDADEKTRTMVRYLTGTAPIFRYYDKNGSELMPPLDVTSVARVQIHFTIDASAGRLPRETNVDTSVQLRNVKTNPEE